MNKFSKKSDLQHAGRTFKWVLQNLLEFGAYTWKSWETEFFKDMFYTMHSKSFLNYIQNYFLDC